MSGAWTVPRLDGRGFTRFTAERFAKSFDERFRDLVIVTARALRQDDLSGEEATQTLIGKGRGFQNELLFRHGVNFNELPAQLPVLSRRVILRYNFDTAERLKRVTCPVLVLHGPEDEIMPFRLGEKVYQAVNEPKVFVKLRGATTAAFF